MSTRITVEQLERMKTHEIAELLTNIVMVLKRLPNVECRQLQEQPGVGEAADLDRMAEMRQMPVRNTAPLTREELRRKTVVELKEMASDLHVPYSGKPKKDELVEKILARHTHAHSEQYAIQDI